MTSVLISVSPDPLHAGDGGTICYDFDSAPEQLSQVTVVLTWTCSAPPSPQPESIILTRTAPCYVVVPPSAAVGITIVDQSGTSGDYQGTVTP